MASILVYEAVQRLHRYLASPLRGVGPGVVDRELVVDGRLVHPGEAFGHPHLVGATREDQRPVRLLRRKVGGLDHERITLPMAPGVAHPGTHMLRHRHGLAHSDDTHVVDLFREDHDVVVGLHDRVIVVVEPVGEHRRAGVGAERHDTAQGEVQILRMVVRAELAIELPCFRAPLLIFGRKGRKAAGCGVRDERASRLAVIDGNPVAPVDVDVVIGSRSDVEHVSGEARTTYRGRPAIGITGRSSVVDELLATPLDRRHLFRRQYSVLPSRAL